VSSSLRGEPLTQEQVPAWAAGASDVRVFVVGSNGHAVGLGRAQEQIPVGEAEIAVASGTSGRSIRTVTLTTGEFRVVAVPCGADFAVVLSQNMAPQERVLKKLGAVMLLFGLAGVIGAAAAGWAVARNGLRPVRRLTRNVERIARTEDLQPLPVEGDDEIARLATAFNDMLVAVSASRDRQRRLVVDAGHELRTPLTSLRTNLDLLLQADASGGLGDAARHELLDDVRAQIEEMSTLVGDLVELARDEPLRAVVEQVDLAEVVDRAVVRARRRGAELTFEVDTEPWWVTGESASLERAVTNLLDNAVKWSPPGGTVRIRLNHGTLTVDDEGPGIAPADREHVFDRFYRSEESRSMPGSGLGLSIVRQVIERHAGNVRVDESEDGGTRMVMQVPGAPLVAG
jgi:two-component system sensor histidine kinase MprB